MDEKLSLYKKEMEQELREILSWWQEHTPDDDFGGFYGRINFAGQIIKEAPKGAVLNARILWTFSSAFLLTRDKSLLQIADRAFIYIRDFLMDDEFGGVYWTVDHRGIPLETRKQIYAQAFAIYGLSEYYQCTGNEKVKDLAVAIYRHIEVHSYDSLYGGYIEACAQNWSAIDDLRLSPKDANQKKSMNTHLHLLEAYANLYKIWADDGLAKKIHELIQMFNEHIIHPSKKYLLLFFDETWKVSPGPVSFGHDIEASWLLQEAADTLGNTLLTESMKETSLILARAVSGAFGKEGGLMNELDPLTGIYNKEKHWWPQAEAMVGYFNAWQNSGIMAYLDRSLQTWNYVKNHLKDTLDGEWFWGICPDGTLMDEDKAGLWKCPYHNGRACMEIIRRINQISHK